MRRLAFLLVMLATLFTTAPALAWGSYGHRTTGDIAMANVSPATAAEIRRLLRHSASLGTSQCPVHTLADAATWPDCLRGEHWRWAFTFAWHYQDAPLCADLFDIKVACPDGNCVTAQIERNRRILADRSLPDAQRLEALAFLVHFIGDLHQPLHMIDAYQGGNAVRGDYGVEPGWNLHSIWDNALAERAISSASPSLVRRYTPAERAALDGGTVEDWARESWDLAKTFIFPRVMPGNPCPLPKEPPVLHWTDADTEAAVPIVADRITRAGLRIARVLDETLSVKAGSARAG